MTALMILLGRSLAKSGAPASISMRTAPAAKMSERASGRSAGSSARAKERDAPSARISCAVPKPKSFATAP